MKKERGGHYDKSNSKLILGKKNVKKE